MTIQLVFLARLRERFGVSREIFALTSDISTVAALLVALRERGGAFAEELAGGRAFRVAVNQNGARVFKKSMMNSQAEKDSPRCALVTTTQTIWSSGLSSPTR